MSAQTTIDMDSTDVELWADQARSRLQPPANAPAGGTDGFDSVDEVEAWFRRRTDIEERIREAKLGAALR